MQKATIVPLPDFTFAVTCSFGTFKMRPRYTLEKDYYSGENSRSDKITREFYIYDIDVKINNVHYNSYMASATLSLQQWKPVWSFYFQQATDKAQAKFNELLLNEVVPYFEDINVWARCNVINRVRERDRHLREISDLKKKIVEQEKKINDLHILAHEEIENDLLLKGKI